MDIVVCVKRVPDISEPVDAVRIGASGKVIDQDNLVFKTNEWDEYALEEAIQLREKLEGTVTAVTLGTEECDETLKRALAMGADRAIRINLDVASADSHVKATILAALLHRLSYDLVMFGMQSEDLGEGQLGPAVAEMIGIPHAIGITELQVQDKEIRVSEELGGRTLASYILRLPALLTIQTGINKPRYISFASVKRARGKEIEVVTPEELNLSQDALTPMLRLEKLELPTVSAGAKIISGSPEDAAKELAATLRNLGVLQNG